MRIMSGWHGMPYRDEYSATADRGAVGHLLISLLGPGLGNGAAVTGPGRRV